MHYNERMNRYKKNNGNENVIYVQYYNKKMELAEVVVSYLSINSVCSQVEVFLTET